MATKNKSAPKKAVKATTKTAKLKRVLTAEGRESIAAAQRKRWRAYKKAQKAAA